MIAKKIIPSGVWMVDSGNCQINCVAFTWDAHQFVFYLFSITFQTIVSRPAYIFCPPLSPRYILYVGWSCFCGSSKTN